MGATPFGSSVAVPEGLLTLPGLTEEGGIVTMPIEYIPSADTVDDLQERARRILPTGVFDHVIGGAGEERTTAANRAGFGRYRLLPRVLTDVSTIDTSVTVLGSQLAAPIFTSPTGGVSLAHPDGERGVARAAAAAGVGFILSGSAAFTIEEVAEVAGAERWYQIYWQGYREVMIDLAERAEASGYKAVVLTVDNAYDGRRPRVVRSAFAFPAEISTRNFERYTTEAWRDRVVLDRRGRPSKGMTPDVALVWRNVEWLKSAIHVPLVLKGIRSPFDAIRAAEAGADAIIISNHGGRSLDGEPATIEALEAIAQALDGRLPIILDGGVRTATDIAIALALGVSAVGLGRPMVWALANGGEATATAFLEHLVEDLERTFGLLGVSRRMDLGRAHVSRRDQYVGDGALAVYAPGAGR